MPPKDYRTLHLPALEEMTIIVILPFVMAILFLFLRRHKSSIAGGKPLPPQPPGFPVLGNLLQLGSLPHRSLASLSKKYGPLILLRLGGGCATVVVSSAEIAEQVMKAQDLIFASRPPSSMADRLLYNSADVAFSPYSDYWRKMKKITTVSLLSSKRVQSFRRVREEEVSLLIAEIRVAASSSSSSTVNLSEKLVALTNGIISRAALGRKFGAEWRFGEMLEEFVALLGCFPAKDLVPLVGGWIDVLTGLDARVRRLSGELDEFLEQVLSMHLSASEGSTAIDAGGDEEGLDFVDVLLSYRDGFDAGDTSTPLRNYQIKALILDMFAAGTDTTFSTIEWAMAELIKSPALMQRVQKEIRDALGSKEFVSEDDIKGMAFLKAVVKEALRLHLPVALLIPRVATEDTELIGYRIPAGSRILINAWAVARDPLIWDRPEEFWPERFIDSDVDFKGKHFQFIPFGAGRRVCPGIGFAVTAVEHTLANLLYHFDWGVPEEAKDEVFDMSESSGITIHKKSALVLIAKLRSA